jgi:von Willebrand factor type A domain
MLVRPRQPLDALSISALDLFASALGAFMLLAVSFFPYYLRAPALERDQEGARAELSAAAQALRQAETASADAEAKKAQAEQALAQARERLVRAQAAVAVRPEAAPAEAEAPAVAVERPVPGPRRGLLAITDLDLVFVMDTTGSMRDELEDLQANLVAIIQVLQRLAPTLRIGFVAYRDRGDAYVVRGSPLATLEAGDAAEILGFVRELTAVGGGDTPERVDEAVAAAVSMPWRTDAQARIIVIGDAPAHPSDMERTMSLAAQFRLSAPNDRFPRALAAIYTGNQPPVKAFFERLARAGGGDLFVHRGQMIESVLLAVLAEPVRGGSGR